MLTWQREGEVDSGEQDGEENVPAEHGDDESADATTHQESGVRDTLSGIEVVGCETGERWNKSNEDEEEDDVGS